MKTDWQAVARRVYVRLTEHADACRLCFPVDKDDWTKAPAAEEVLVSTACDDGVLLFSEWLTARSNAAAQPHAMEVEPRRSGVVVEAELVRLRHLLKQPPIDACALWWSALSEGERRTLVRHAGLDGQRRFLRWQQLSGAEREALLASAHRAAAWGRVLFRRLADQRRAAETARLSQSTGG